MKNLLLTLALLVLPELLRPALTTVLGDWTFAAAYLYLLGVGVLMMRRAGIAATDIGLAPKQVARGAGLFAALLLASMTAFYLMSSWNDGGSFGDCLAVSGITAGEFARHWLVVGPVEELVWRGVVLTLLMSGHTRWRKLPWVLLPVVVGTTLFCAWHSGMLVSIEQFNAKAFTFLFVISSLLSYFFLRTRSVVFVALAHGYSNANLIGTHGEQAVLLLLVVALELYLLATLLWRRLRPNPATVTGHARA